MNLLFHPARGGSYPLAQLDYPEKRATFLLLGHVPLPQSDHLVRLAQFYSTSNPTSLRLLIARSVSLTVPFLGPPCHLSSHVLHAVSDQMLSSLREPLGVPVLGPPGLDGIPTSFAKIALSVCC